MNLRKVVCVLCASVLCAGLVLANDLGNTNAVKSTAVAPKAPGTQPDAVSASSQPQLAAKPTAVPAGVHVRPLGASRTCVNYIYDNCPNVVYYYPGMGNLPFDTCVQPIPGQENVSCYYVEFIATTVPVTVITSIAPHEGVAPYAGTEQTTVIDTAGGWGITIDLDTPVYVGADLATYGYIVVRQQYNQLDCGPLLGEEAECGVSPNNWFYQNGGYWWWGGDPFAAFSASLFGPEDTPFTGACCLTGSCFETDDYYTCQYVYNGQWFPFESCPEFTACPHLGACCKGGLCIGTMYEANCTAQGGTWFTDEDCDAGYICPAPPSNDNCGDVAPFVLVPGTPVRQLGDNSYATQDCSLLWPEVWHVFTTTQTLDVKIDFCGSPTYFGTIGIALVPDCPCGSWLGADFWSWDCTDGNVHLEYNALPAGTHYYPVYSAGATGPYQITFTASGGALLGDVNCDGLVNPFDIDPFVQCLVSGTPTAPCTSCQMADINGDGLVNPFDIDPFVECIINGGCL